MRGSRCWAVAYLHFLLVSIQLPTICLAHDSVQLDVQVVTASATTPDQPSSTITATTQTHTIQVGLADHKFRPEATVANVGDTVEFAFYPLNHSVVRAEYGFPCIPYEMTGASKTGFFSNFHPVDTVLSSPPIYRIVINDTDPIFFYCSAPGSCINYGMVGAINPNATASVQEQHQLALGSKYMLNPGDPFPAEETPLSRNSPSKQPSGTPASSPITENTTNTKSRLSTRAIIAMSVTSASITILAALLFFFWGRTKSLKEEIKRKAGLSPRPPTSPSDETRMLDSRAELGTSSSGPDNSTNSNNALHRHHHHLLHQQQQQQQQYYMHPHIPSVPPDNPPTPYHHPYPTHPAYPPSLSQIPLYFPHPPPTRPQTSSPSPIPTPPPSRSHIHPSFLPSQATQGKYDIPSPMVQHPAYLPVEYYAAQQQQQQQQVQVQVRHELSTLGDSDVLGGVGVGVGSGSGSEGGGAGAGVAGNADTITPVQQEGEGEGEGGVQKSELGVPSPRVDCAGEEGGEKDKVPGYFDAVFDRRLRK